MTERSVGEPWQMYSKKMGVDQKGQGEEARRPMPEMANATKER